MQRGFAAELPTARRDAGEGIHAFRVRRAQGFEIPRLGRFKPELADPQGRSIGRREIDDRAPVRSRHDQSRQAFLAGLDLEHHLGIPVGGVLLEVDERDGEGPGRTGLLGGPQRQAGSAQEERDPGDDLHSPVTAYHHS